MHFILAWEPSDHQKIGIGMLVAGSFVAGIGSAAAGLFCWRKIRKGPHRLNGNERWMTRGVRKSSMYSSGPIEFADACRRDLLWQH